MKTFYEIDSYSDGELYNRKIEVLSNFFENFYQKIKDKPNVVTSQFIDSKHNKFFSRSIWNGIGFLDNIGRKAYPILFGLESGIAFSHFYNGKGYDLGDSILFIYYDDYFKHNDYWHVNLMSINKEFKIEGNLISYKIYKKKSTLEDVGILKKLIDDLNSIANKFDNDLQKELDDKIQLEKQQEIEKADRIKREKEQLKESKKSIIQKLDTDNNGVIDLIDNDFPKLISKYQKQIIGIDKNYIHQFVKVSNYISTKRNNIQVIFKSIDKINSKTDLDKRINLLKNQVHTYDLFIFHSLNMIEALVSEDLITFYEIYEKFDKIGIYNSNWENEVSIKLTSIGSNLSSLGDKLDLLLDSISKMEQSIVSEIGYMNYSTQESFGELNDSLTSSLKSINSSVDVNNLFTAISTYQLYKINKQTKSLLPKK